MRLVLHIRDRCSPRGYCRSGNPLRVTEEHKIYSSCLFVKETEVMFTLFASLEIIHICYYIVSRNTQRSERPRLYAK